MIPTILSNAAPLPGEPLLPAEPGGVTSMIWIRSATINSVLDVTKTTLRTWHVAEADGLGVEASAGPLICSAASLLDLLLIAILQTRIDERGMATIHR